MGAETLLLIALFLIALAEKGRTNIYRSDGGSHITPVPVAPALALESITERNIQKPRMNITYPQLEGLEDKNVEGRVNRIIFDEVSDLINKQGYNEGSLKEIWGWYKIKANRNNILSIVFEHYSYTQGAAHGLTVIRSINTDLQEGKLLTFSDLFKPGTNYKERINDIILRQIKEKDVPLIAEFAGVNENQEFYLTDNELVLYYQLYEYTPYAYGIPEFSIPYYSIKNIINNNGSIGRIYLK